MRFVLCVCVALWRIASLAKFDRTRLLLSLRGWTSITLWASGPFTASNRQNLTGSFWSLLAVHCSVPQVAPGFACRVRQRSNELLISVVRTKGGTEWSVTITFRWSAAVQQQTRAGDELRCSDQSWNSSCLNCYIVSFVHPQCILCWRALCALLLLWEEKWVTLYAPVTNVIHAYWVSSWTCCITPVKQWSLQGNKETPVHLMVELRRAAQERMCIIQSQYWMIHRRHHSACFHITSQEKKSFVVDTVLTWSILNS